MGNGWFGVTYTKKEQDKKTSESRYENTQQQSQKEEVVEEGNIQGQLAYVVWSRR